MEPAACGRRLPAFAQQDFCLPMPLACPFSYPRPPPRPQARLWRQCGSRIGTIRSFLWVVVLDSRTPTPTRASLNTGAAGLVDKPLDPSGIDAHPSPSGRLTLPSTFVNTGRSHAVAPCRTRTRGGCDARRPSDGRPAEGARVKRERPRAPPTIPQHGEARAQAAVGRRARAGGVHHAIPLLQPVPGCQGAFVRSLGWG